MTQTEQHDDAKPCPVCQSQALVEIFDHAERHRVDCPACGKFVITVTAKQFAKQNEIVGSTWRAVVSYWIRQRQNHQREIEIDRNLMELLLKEVKLPGHRVQADNLIRYFGENLGSPEQYLSVDHRVIGARIGANLQKGVNYIVQYLIDKKYSKMPTSIDKNTGKHIVDTNRLRLTFKGWDRYEKIKQQGTPGRIAFMAMQYNDKEHDSVYFGCFKPAVKQAGFELRRLDENLAAGLIDNQLRVEIRNAQFLLADLTNDNLGAYWEAGFAEGLGKPVIYLCRKEHFDRFKTHFDTNHHTTIVWDSKDWEATAKNLKSTIRATLPLEAKMTDD